MYRKKVEEMRAQKQEREVEGCTFTPHVNVNKNSLFEKRKSVDPTQNYNNVF